MADTRCDLSDLPASMCAHCLGHTESNPAADIVIERTCTAVWDGRCGLDARHPIRRGDRVGHSERGWLCTACTKAGAR